MFVFFQAAFASCMFIRPSHRHLPQRLYRTIGNLIFNISLGHLHFTNTVANLGFSALC